MSLFKRLLSCTLFFLSLFGANLALASASAEGGHAAGPGLPILWKVINFSIIAFVLYKVGKKAMPGILEKRREDVAKALDQAQERENEAAALFNEYEEKLGDLESQIEALTSQAKQRAQKQSATILDKAEREAKDLVASAKRSAKRIEEQAELGIRKLVTDEALRLAEINMRSQYEPDTAAAIKKQSKLVEQFTSEVGRFEKQ
jgi:F-type H+-transporting ATPase subunit b